MNMGNQFGGALTASFTPAIAVSIWLDHFLLCRAGLSCLVPQPGCLSIPNALWTRNEIAAITRKGLESGEDQVKCANLDNAASRPKI